MIDIFFYIGKMCIAFFLLGDWGRGGVYVCGHIFVGGLTLLNLKKKKKKEEEEANLKLNIGPKED